MAGQRDMKRNRRSRSTSRGRRRVVGLGASAAAFVAFGLAPLTTAPTANADEFDAILDPILTALISSVDHSFAALDASWAALDPSAAGLDPSAGLEVGGVAHRVAGAVGAPPPPQEDISTNAAAATPTCPAGTICEISENGTVLVNTCLVGGVQECTAVSLRVGDEATAVGAGSSAYAEGGPGDTAYATLGGEAIAKGSYDDATAEGTRSLAEAYGTNVAATPSTAIATGTGGTNDYAIASRGGEAVAVGGSGDKAEAAGSGAGSGTVATASGGNNDTATALGTASGAFSDGNNDTATANGDNAEAIAANGDGDRATAAGNAANLNDKTFTTAYAGGLAASGVQAEIAGNSDTATATGTGAEAYAGN